LADETLPSEPAGGEGGELASVEVHSFG
jgi:hypothetical protein